MSISYFTLCESQKCSCLPRTAPSFPDVPCTRAGTVMFTRKASLAGTYVKNTGSFSIASGMFYVFPLLLHHLPAGRMAALKYARLSFGPLGISNLDGIQRLMGHLCFLNRSCPGPYSDLASVKLWDEVARDFTRHCCGLLGQVGSFHLTVFF